MTAAHCVEYFNNASLNVSGVKLIVIIFQHELILKTLGRGVSLELIVVAREHNLNKTDGETRHKVCNMTMHPQWNKTIMYDFDFAILNLCEPMMFDKGQFLSQFSFDFSGFPN